jgi:ribosome-binding factor A
MNPRTKARLEARILERAAHAIEFEVRDPRATFITLTRVELSPDLSIAKIYWSVLGGPGDRSKAEHMLESAGGFIQRQVARVLETRRVPRLAWYFDESLIKAQELDKAIRAALERDKVIAETGKPPEGDDDSEWEQEYEGFAESQPPPPVPPDSPPPPAAR